MKHITSKATKLNDPNLQRVLLCQSLGQVLSSISSLEHWLLIRRWTSFTRILFSMVEPPSGTTSTLSALGTLLTEIETCLNSGTFQNGSLKLSKKTVLMALENLINASTSTECAL